MSVLIKVSFYDSIDSIADRFLLRQQLQCSLLNLLYDISLAIGMVNIHVSSLLIDKCFITHWFKTFPGLYQGHYCSIDGLCAQIKIAGIIPTTDIQARYMFSWFK